MISDDQSASDNERGYKQNNQIQDYQQADDLMEDEIEEKRVSLKIDDDEADMLFNSNNKSKVE